MKNTPLIMPEYGFSLTGNLPYKDRTTILFLFRKIRNKENPHFGIFYAMRGKSKSLKDKNFNIC